MIFSSSILALASAASASAAVVGRGHGSHEGILLRPRQGIVGPIGGGLGGGTGTGTAGGGKGGKGGKGGAGAAGGAGGTGVQTSGAAAPGTTAPPALEVESNSIVGVYTVSQDTGNSTPLFEKKFPWPYLPEHADTGTGPRGHMLGFNICNSTTETQDSNCMTAFLNTLDDFCLWGAQQPGAEVGVVEARMVAYCTKPGHGTRLIPDGALQGVQFIQTSDYVEVVGFIDQAALNLAPDTPGGEEDPHGADDRGNPIGSLLYSSAFNATNPDSVQGITQINQWSYFIGNNVFCFKACDPNGPSDQASELCQHIYDEIGCTFNDPANYAAINGTFQACDGDNQMPAGVYVSAGITTTYEQGSTPPPYVASIPPTSNCAMFQSAQLFNGLAGVSAAPQPNATAVPTGGAGVGFDPSTTMQGGATPAQTGASGAATATGGVSAVDTSGAAPRGVWMGVGGSGWMAAAMTASAAVCGLALL